MIPESQFHYRRINEALFREIVEAIMFKRRSQVLLGARDCGKRYIMHRLPDWLKDAGAPYVVAIDFHRPLPWESEAELAKEVEKKLRIALGCAPLAGSEEDGALQSCLEAAIAQAPGIVLLASGVDELGPHLSLLFVQVIRKLVQGSAPSLTVVLTGEVNFQDLVHGPGSAFENCAQQIVIQGYDEEEFAKVAEHRAKAVNIELDPADIRSLFLRTGGQLHLLLALLDAWTRFTSSYAVKQDPKAALRPFLRQMRGPGNYGLELLHHAADLIGQYPGEWSRLESLIQNRCPSAGLNPPGPLELAGLAVRDREDRLHFCSPLIARRVRRYFHPRRWGDWYGHLGRWAEALTAYEQIKPAQRLRPSGPDDRSVTWNLVRGYGSYLYSLASAPADKVTQQRLELRVSLQRGLQLLLGVRSVTFWRRGERGWHSIAPLEPPSSTTSATGFLPRVPTYEHRPQLGWRAVQSPFDQECLVALIAPERDDQPEALVISEFGSGHVLTRERQNLVRELGSVFLRAYEHLSSVARAITRAEQRRKFEEIAATALSGIESQQTPRQILEAAGNALRTIGYKRLLFSLLDPSGRYIKGEVDVSWNPAVDVAAATCFQADRPDTDIQAWVVHHHQPKRVAEPLKEPGVNLKIVEAANIGPFAILPLLGQNGEALGTLHIEREDGSLPTQEEVDDFIAFGRRLSHAIERCERVALYQPALQLLRDPVVIIDPLNRIRFANEAARTEFGVRAGWHAKREAETTRHVFDKDEPVLEIIKSALEQSQRTVRNLAGVGLRKRRMTVVAQPIPEGAKHGDSHDVGGVLLHFRDYHYIWTGYDTLSRISEEISVPAYLDRLLELPKALGHEWARLWLCPDVFIEELDLTKAPLNQSAVISIKSYHDTDEELNTIFPHDPPLILDDAESSKVVCDGKVLVYEEVSRPAEPYITESGLPVIPFRNPPHSAVFKRKEGDRWINFPLRGTEGKKIGLISMDLPAEFRARNLEDLNQLAELIGSRLTILLQGRHLKAASERAIADVSHEVVSRLAAFGLLLDRFSSYALRHPEAAELVDDLARFANRGLAAVRDIKDAFVVPPLEQQQMPLRDWLRTTVQRLGWEGSVTVAPGEEVLVYFDPRHLERCLVELLKNAKDFAREGVPMHIRIDAGLMTDGDATGWITVSDNGRGIPKDKRKLIFEDFYSFRPEGHKSSGLGLATARRMMEAHGGTIAAGGHFINETDDPSSAGAVFYLTWPDLPPPPRPLPHHLMESLVPGVSAKETAPAPPPPTHILHH